MAVVVASENVLSHREEVRTPSDSGARDGEAGSHPATSQEPLTRQRHGQGKRDRLRDPQSSPLEDEKTGKGSIGEGRDDQRDESRGGADGDHESKATGREVSV